MIDSVYKEFISQFGVWGVVIASLVAIFVGGGIYFVQYKIKDYYTKKNSNDIVDELISEQNLEHHRLFGTLEHQITHRIPNLSIFPEKPIREKLLKDIVLIFVTSFHDSCKEIAKYDTTNWTSDRWANKMVSDISVALKAFDDECKRMGMPPAIIQKYNTWNRLSLDNLLENVRSLSTSSLFETNTAKTGALLICIENLIITTISDAEYTLRTLNGEISGQEYKGGIIED